jgi:hypothetical protein
LVVGGLLLTCYNPRLPHLAYAIVGYVIVGYVICVTALPAPSMQILKRRRVPQDLPRAGPSVCAAGGLAHPRVDQPVTTFQTFRAFLNPHVRFIPSCLACGTTIHMLPLSFSFNLKSHCSLWRLKKSEDARTLKEHDSGFWIAVSRPSPCYCERILFCHLIEHERAKP